MKILSLITLMLFQTRKLPPLLVFKTQIKIFWMNIFWAFWPSIDSKRTTTIKAQKGTKHFFKQIIRNIFLHSFFYKTQQ